MKIARRFNAGKSSVHWRAPKGRLNPRVRPSLRDLVPSGVEPGVKTPGYCRPFLRNWPLIVERRVEKLGDFHST
jgi:hypothetical protein